MRADIYMNLHDFIEYLRCFVTGSAFELTPPPHRKLVLISCKGKDAKPCRQRRSQPGVHGRTDGM